MSEKVTRAAVYARVSIRATASKEQRQDPEVQLRELRVACQQAGYQTTEYVDRETGTGKRKRGAFEKMMEDARQKRFEVIVVWALDRLSREGTLKTLTLIDQLNSLGIRIRSLREPWLDPGSATYELLLPTFAWIAKQEAIRISERVTAGLARAKALGVRLGRPPIEVDADAVYAAYCGMERPSIRDLAKRFNLSRSYASALILKQKRSGGNGQHPAADRRLETA